MRQNWKDNKIFYFTDEQMKGYGEGHPIVTDDCPVLEFSSAKTIILGRDPSFVLSDNDSFLAVKNE